MSIERIRGFCNFDDIYGHYVHQAENGSVFVEIGSLFGRSTAAMAYFIKVCGKHIKFYSIDYWDLRGITDKKWSDDDLKWFKAIGVDPNDPDVMYEGALKIWKHYGVMDYVYPIKMDSRKAVNLFDDQSINFLFIDGDHAYEGVKADIQLWLPKIAHGGIIAGHDYDWAGVRQAVDETFGGHVVQHGTSWVVNVNHHNPQLKGITHIEASVI